MSTTSLKLSRDFTSFSGTDIRVVIEGETIGSIQALSYAVQREKGPVYVMGRVDPLSFSRGKRGIAGTMITLMLDRHPLYKEPFANKQFVADKDEIYPTAGDLGNVADTADLFDPTTATFNSGDVSDNYSVRGAWYFDQLPPMDYVVVAANEYGKASTMRVYGAEFLNEGSGFSVDDMVIENQMTYIARTILPWQPLGSWDFDGGGIFDPVTDPTSP